MSREIKFRGIELKSRFMVYGFYVVSNGCDSIVTDETKQKQLYIVSDTLSQYTGIKDRNGVEIYEGDICRDTNYNGIGITSWNNTYMQWDIGIKGNWADDTPYVRMYIEVIGNIYENNELLK